MAIDALVRERARVDHRIPTPGAGPPDMIRIAQYAWAYALDSSAARTGLDSATTVLAHMRVRDGVATMHCCHGLAEEVAASLRATHQDIRAIYAPDCDTCPQDFCLDKGFVDTPLVHLLVWAQNNSPALRTRTAALGNALARVYEEITGGPGPSTLLHAQVVSDGDLEKLFGAGQRQRWPTRLQAYLLSLDDPISEL